MLAICEQEWNVRLTPNVKRNGAAHSKDEGMLYTALKDVSDPNFTPAVNREFGKVCTLTNFWQSITRNARVARRRGRCRRSAFSLENLGSCAERPLKRS